MRNDSGHLKKMEIESFTDIDCTKKAGDKFIAMFNPEKYSRNYEILTEEKKGAGKSGGTLLFKGLKPQEFSFDFLLDGTGAVTEKVEVADKIKEFLDTVYKVEGKIHRPKYLKLNWGEAIAKCMLKKAAINYSMFDPGGKPLRASIKADFTENISDKLRDAMDKPSSPDLTHTRTVKEGDTLAGLVYDIYESLDPLLIVAKANSLNSMRQLTPGQSIKFPPIKEFS